MSYESTAPITPGAGSGARDRPGGHGGRSSGRDYNQVVAALRSAKKDAEVCAAKARKSRDENRSKDQHIADLKREWEEKERRYKRRIDVLINDLKTKKQYHGRSQLRAEDMDKYDNANRPIINNFMRFVILPHHKFLHNSWKDFTPENKLSFYYRLKQELAIPPNAVVMVYYKDKVVPRVNKYLIDWRANVGTAIKEAYMGE